MSLSKPNQIAVPFAESGLKTAIPANADNVLGRAGYDQGFPPINMTAKVAGGIPPFGQDMNGILYAIDKAVQYNQAGMLYPYDSTFATAIGGYNIGAKVLRTDGLGAWINTVNNNTTNPDTGGAGWVPDYTYGIAAITMTGSNVTLTALQYGQNFISITGTLSANVQLIFPNNISGDWIIFNNATMGLFSITAKTVSGTGVSISSGTINVSSNGVNMYLVGGSQASSTVNIVTGSRVFGTAYFNTGSTTRFCTVSVSVGGSAGSPGIYLSLNAGADQLMFGNANASSYTAPITFAVPPAMSYNLKSISGTNSIVSWVEVS